MSRPRTVAIVVVTVLLVAGGLAIAFLAQQRDITIVNRVQLVVIARGCTVRLGEAPPGVDRVSRVVSGDESDSFELPDSGSPAPTIARALAADGAVAAQPPWEIYGDLKAYRLPHMFEEPIRFADSPRHTWLFSYRHVDAGVLRGLPIRVEAEPGHTIRWLSTQKSEATLDDWWYNTVLRQEVHLWRIEITFEPRGT